MTIDPLDVTSRLRRAAAALSRLEASNAELRARLSEVERANNEHIAIVSMACRFPGASTPEAFWKLLEDGVDAVREIPARRWKRPVGLAPHERGRLHAALLDEDLLEGFDPGFFGIAPREATSLDPQQRLVLEVSWEALERACWVPDANGANIGVFVGVCGRDYAERVAGTEIDLYATTGNAPSFTAGRVAYAFGLIGPAVVVDTACSSSLVAVHLACQSLRAGECEAAIAGGVNLLLSPTMMEHLARTQALSPDGRCKTFDAAANGFVRGEGCGVVLLKRLSRAQADGDRVLAVIRGSAINQDGRSTGLTAPNGLAQEAVLRDALARANLTGADVDYLEAHGTGTSLGDPIEYEALRSVFGERTGGGTCVLGAVKTNIGHLEAAAGIAGLIKAVLVFAHERIPRNLHFRTLNPRMSLEGTRFVIPTDAVPHARGARARRAGISSFGLSGTNAHVIVEEAPVRVDDAAPRADAPCVLPLSAKTAPALRELAGRYAARLSGPEASAERLADVAAAAARGRMQFSHRAAVVATTVDEASRQLAALAAGDVPAGTWVGADPHGAPTHSTAPAAPAAIEALPGEEPARSRMLASLAAGYAAGADVRWSALYPSWRPTVLPTYPWQRERCWLELPTPGSSAPSHDPHGSARDARAVVVPLCAASAGALAALASTTADLVDRVGLDAALAARPPSATGERLAIVARDRETAAALLRRAASGDSDPAIVRGARRDHAPRLAFVFGGHGSQWAGMGRELLDSDPVFLVWMRRCERALRPYVDWQLTDVVAASDRSWLDRSDIVQPAIWGLQVSLAAMWESWGVVPHAVVGHSMGEVAAGCAAGLLSLEHGAQVICRRSQIVRRVRGRGGMAIVELPERELGAWLARHAGAISVAVVNSERSTVVAGEVTALDALLGELERASIFCRRVNVDYASHSPLMDELTEELSGALAGVRGRPGRLPMISTVTGQPIGWEALDARYWVANLRQPVVFGRAMQQLAGDGFDLFVEISPNPVLLPAVEGEIRARGGRVAFSLRRGQPDREALLESAAAIWTAGGELDFAAMAETSTSAVPARGRAGELLGERRASSVHAGLHWFEATIGLASHPYLAGHGLEGVAVFPATAYLEMALAAGREVLGERARVVEQVTLHEALALRADETHQLQLVLEDEGSGRARFRVSSRACGSAGERGWTLHASGWVRAEEPAVLERLPVDAIRARCAVEHSDEQVYAALAGAGIDYSGAFRGVHQVSRGGGECFGRVAPPPGLSSVPFAARLDAVLQVWAVGLIEQARGPAMIVEVGSLRSHAPLPDVVFVHAQTVGPETGELVVVDADGEVVLELRGVRSQRLHDRPVSRRDPLLLESRWRPRERAPDAQRDSAARTGQGRAWCVLAGEDGFGARLAQGLEQRGDQVVTLRASELAELSAQTLAARLEHAVGKRRCAAVIDAWPLDARVDEASTAADVLGTQQRTCGTLLPVVQALAKVGWRDVPRLYVVTRGAQPVDDGGDKRALAIAQASLWGFTRVVEFEYPELHPTLIDLDPDLDPAQAGDETALVCSELLASPPEEEIAYRDGRRWVAQLERPALADPLPERQPGPVRKDGTYLVTGGLGDLGLAAAEWLAAEGAGRIVLMSRSGATTDEQRAAVQALRDRGADLAVAHGDIAHRADLDRVLCEQVAADRPLRGVLHAAVVVDDALLATMTWPHIEKVFAAKVLGAWNLHQATRGLALDWFVLYASAVGFIGAPGQANYAAANSFLDALAHHRRALGLHALSIDWTAFRDTPKEALTARLTHRGFGSLTRKEGVALLDRLLREDATQRAALPLDVRQWREFYPHIVQSTRYARLLQEAASRPAVRAPAAWTQGSESERRQALAAVVRAQLARVLRIAGERIEPRAPFRNLGLDSLMSLELRNRLEAELGLTLATTVTWAHPHLEALANHLAERLGVTAPAPVAPPADRMGRDEVDVAALRAEVSAMSEDGLLAELEREIAAPDGAAPEHNRQGYR